ncbi:head completion adaptor [Vibrio phage 1.038.O._10N.286.51.C2]|nr:head completion adaptor [Vibrio phage 1.038.O._10N.286.51.C2]
MEITDQVISDFREWYDEFSDTTVWSNPSVKKALCKADFQTGSSRWGSYVYADMCGSFKALGLFAYAAHILSISNAAKKTTQMGQIASSVAPVSSKSVASESVGFARSSGRPNSNGFDDLLASTVYGQEYLGYWNAASQGAVMV